MDNLFFRDGVPYLKVKPSYPLSNSKLISDIYGRGDTLAVDLTTGVTRVLKEDPKMEPVLLDRNSNRFTESEPVITFETDGGSLFKLHTNREFAEEQLRNSRYKQGVITCKSVGFSTYYNGYFTRHMEILWNRVYNYMHRGCRFS